MNRREFLQALGIATGASVLPVKAWARQTLALPTLEDSRIQIDGEWYALKEWEIELLLPPPIVKNGCVAYDPALCGVEKQDWEFRGVAFNLFNMYSVSTFVPITLSLYGRIFTGQAYITISELIVHMYDPIVTKFALKGEGPLSKNKPVQLQMMEA